MIFERTLTMTRIGIYDWHPLAFAPIARHLFISSQAGCPSQVTILPTVIGRPFSCSTETPMLLEPVQLDVRGAVLSAPLLMGLE